MNQKGGVGKTTTTVNLGAALAELGQRVCLIDLDPQAHLTINYGVEPSIETCSLYNILVEERDFWEGVRQITPQIYMVPSSIDLAAAEIELVTVLGRETLLKKRMEEAAVGQDFDFVLLDCPPSLGLLTLNALSVADEVIIPMQPHFLAMQGVAKLLETVRLVNHRMNPRLKVTGIVLTMFDSQTKLTGEVVAELDSFVEAAQGKGLPWSGAKIFQSKIRRNIKLAESPSFGQTIFAYEPASNGATDYRALGREVLGLPPEAPMPPQVAKIAVTMNPAIDETKLAAAKVRKPRTRKPKISPQEPGAEVASVASSASDPAPLPSAADPLQPDPARADSTSE